MRHSLKKPLINLTLFIGSLMFVRYLFQEKFASLFFTYIAPIYSPVNGDFWVSLIVILLLSFFMSAFFSLIIFKSINKLVAYTFYMVYFVTLGYFLFFKSVGVSGYSLNPFSFVVDLLNGDGRIEALFNVIYFIPLGFLIGKKYLLFLISVTMTEILQLTFSLGFFDLGDILLNFSGFYIGARFYHSTIRNLVFNKPTP